MCDSHQQQGLASARLSRPTPEAETNHAYGASEIPASLFHPLFDLFLSVSFTCRAVSREPSSATAPYIGVHHTHLPLSNHHFRYRRNYRTSSTTTIHHHHDRQWEGLLGLLPEADSTRVRAFLRENDRKLALGSRLLQRAVVSKARKSIDEHRTQELGSGRTMVSVLTW